MSEHSKGLPIEPTEVTIPPIDAALLDHLIVEFDAHGRRSVEFLQTAETLLALEGAATAPRSAETVAYCLREAMKTILESQTDLRPGSWRSASRSVTAARRRFDLVRGVPGEDEAGALHALLDAVDGLEQVHEQDGIHQRRLIGIMVNRTGAVPLSVGIEPVKSYQTLLEDLDSALHNETTTEMVRELWGRSIQLLRQLFLPPDLRNSALARLGSKRAPTQADVEALLELLAGPNHLHHFLSCVEDPGWLDALTESGVLDPPAGGGPWPVFVAIERLSSNHQADVIAWLRRMADRHSSDASRSWFVARAAADAGPAALPLVLRALSRYGADPRFSHLGMLAVERSAPESDLVELLADLLLTPAGWQNLGYADPILQRLLAGLNSANAKRRAEVLCWKLRAIDENGDSRRWLRYERAGSIAEWGIESDDRFSALMGALVEVFRLALASDWIPLPEALSLVDGLEEEVRCRVRAWLLANAPASEPALMVSEITLGISTRDPTGDDLPLIDRVVAFSEPASYLQQWADALGAAPATADVAEALAAHHVPLSVRRAFHRVGILPEAATAHWMPVSAILAAAWGRPGREALQTRMRVEAAWGRSPMTVDDLNAIQPLDAAAAIAAWRRDPSEILVGPRELAGALESAVMAEPARWMAEPVRVVTALKHPTYIHRFLTAAEKLSKEMPSFPVSDLMDVVALVRTHPWPAEVLGREDFDYDSGWDGAEQAGVELMKALADSDLGFAGREDEVWAILESETLDRSQASNLLSGGRDPLDHAINRRCTRALDAVLSFMAYEFRAVGTVRRVTLTLLEEALRLDGADGAQHRAILATRLGFLQHVAPEWFEQADELFFGAQAPAGLSQVTVDLAITWGQPNRWLLQHHRGLVRDAAIRNTHNAIEQVLLAMLWEIPGYTVHDNVQFLRQSPDQLSNSGEALGRLLRHQRAEAPHIALAAQFWDSAILVGGGASLGGFGWMAEVSQMEDELWAELTEKTLARTGGRIDWAHKVAERASNMPQSTTTLAILNSLVRGVADEWDRRGMAERAASVLANAFGLESTTEYSRLRTTLLERGAL